MIPKNPQHVFAVVGWYFGGCGQSNAMCTIPSHSPKKWLVSAGIPNHGRFMAARVAHKKLIVSQVSLPCAPSPMTDSQVETKNRPW
jgi:hypothetical protein